MNAKLTLYEEFERLPTHRSAPTLSARRAGGLRLVQWLVRALTTHEPRITLRSGHHGPPLFDAFDPITGRRIHRASEADLRIWLEQRYSATPDVPRSLQRYPYF